MKKLLPFLSFGSLLITLSIILKSFAIFETDVAVNTETELADWQILINGSALNNTNNTFNIDTFNWGTSEYVLPGRASPGLPAYFEIIIDPRGSQVSMEYEISLDFSVLNNDKIEFVSIKDKNGNNLIEKSPGVYTGQILIGDILALATEKIRVDLQWIDDPENNLVDSSVVNNPNAEINIPVSVKFSQYLE